MKRSTEWLLRAGWLPLPWFLFWTTLAGLFAPGYSPLARHASELTLKPGIPRVLLDVAALGTGLAFCIFAAGLRRVSERRFPLGAISWLIFGVSMASNGFWPMGGPLHGLYGIGVFNLIAPALSLLEVEPLRDHKKLYAITAFVSVAGVIYLWLNLTGNDPEGFRGLTQRVFSSIHSLWPATFATVCLRSAKAATD